MSELDRKRKRAHSKKAASQRELELEQFIFGTTTPAEPEGSKPFNGKLLSYNEGSDSESEEMVQLKKQKTEVSDAPAWHDEDDEDLEVKLDVKGKNKWKDEEDESVKDATSYQNKLREYHASLNTNVSWAHVDEEEDPFLTSANKLLRSTHTKLPQTTLSFTPVADANAQEPSKAVIQAVEFHKGGEFLFTVGLDKSLRLFEIDPHGKSHTKLASVFYKHFPITSACFSASGEQILLAGQRENLWTYDVTSGKSTLANPFQSRSHAEKEYSEIKASADGNFVAVRAGGDHASTIKLLAKKNMTWLSDFTSNEKIHCMSFSSDSKYLHTAGAGGEVYVWDLAQRRCVARYKDFATQHTTAIANSPRGLYQATGSDSGVTNIYKYESLPLPGSTSHPAPQPLKSIMNLRTSINTLTFNHDAQILAMTSGEKSNSIRLVHLPSATVFSNFPAISRRQHTAPISALAFSPDSTFLAIGTVRGRVHLRRLNHFEPLPLTS